MFPLFLSTSVLDCKFSEICLSKRGKIIFQIICIEWVGYSRYHSTWYIVDGFLSLYVYISNIMAIDTLQRTSKELQ